MVEEFYGKTSIPCPCWSLKAWEDCLLMQSEASLFKLPGEEITSPVVQLSFFKDATEMDLNSHVLIIFTAHRSLVG